MLGRLAAGIGSSLEIAAGWLPHRLGGFIRGFRAQSGVRYIQWSDPSIPIAILKRKGHILLFSPLFLQISDRPKFRGTATLCYAFGWRWVRLTFSTIAYFSYLRPVPFLFRSFCPSCQLVVVLFSWVLCKCRSRVRAAHGVLASISNESNPRISPGCRFSGRNLSRLSLVLFFFFFFFFSSKGPASPSLAGYVRRSAALDGLAFGDFSPIISGNEFVDQLILRWLKGTQGRFFDDIGDVRLKNWEATRWSVCYEIYTKLTLICRSSVQLFRRLSNVIIVCALEFYIFIFLIVSMYDRKEDTYV